MTGKRLSDPYWQGVPRIWIRTIAVVWLIAASVFVCFVVLWSLWHSRIISHEVFQAIAASIGVAALLLEIGIMVSFYARVPVKRSRVTRGELLCPECGYPVFTIDETGASRECSECGVWLRADEVLRAWAKVPEHRRLFRQDLQENS